MNKPEIILVGGGGHCKSCIDVIETENKYSILGIIDLPSEFGKLTLDYKVIGNDDDLPELAKKGFNFLITLGHMGKSRRRKQLFKIIADNGGKIPTIVSPKSHISKHSTIGKGTIIMHHALINADSIIGDNCIINNKALIEHDATIGNDTHISTGAIVNGDCKVGHDCLIGSASVIKHSISICENTIIGAGAVVVNDIIESGVYVGSPAKKIK